MLCYDSAKDCNIDCTSQDCYPDVATCATGYAGGYVQNIWICPADNALFTATSTPSALPNGKGSYCFTTANDCGTATNTTAQCFYDTAICATGQAGPTQYNWVHQLDQANVTTIPFHHRQINSTIIHCQADATTIVHHSHQINSTTTSHSLRS